MAKIAVASVLVLLAAASPQGTPLNAQCPVKPGQKSRASIVLTLDGQTIGFC